MNDTINTPAPTPAAHLDNTDRTSAGRNLGEALDRWLADDRIDHYWTHINEEARYLNAEQRRIRENQEDWYRCDAIARGEIRL